jgi:hypothetical protein
MERIINYKDRDGILKNVAIAVCMLELLIVLLTLAYQQDVVKRTETPITQEMAQTFILQPEKLKPNERVAFNSYGRLDNQQTYLLVKEAEEVIPFPWKAWILISVGTPIGIAFLVMLLTMAYFQAVDPGERDSAQSTGKFATALNRLSQINIIWFMLLSIIVLFFFWYIPEVVKYTGGMAITWLTRYWWIPAIVFGVVVSVVFFWIYLQYKLRLRAMNMEMELAKFKFLQMEGHNQLLLGERNAPAAQLSEEGRSTEEQTDQPKETDESVPEPDCGSSAWYGDWIGISLRDRDRDKG